MTTRASPDKALMAAQRSVYRRSSLGLVVAAFIVYVVCNHAPWLPLPALTTAADRLIFTLRWQLPSVFLILLGVGDVGRRRLFSHAIDPVGPRDQHLVVIPSRILQNTLEQLVMNSAGQLMLSTYLGANQMRVIPALTVVFVLGRVAYYAGYQRPELGRSGRSVGFGMTIYPTLCVLGYCMYRFVQEMVLGVHVL